MFYVIISVCCSVTVSVFLKLARRYEISVAHAVVWNYLVCSLLTLLIYRPEISVKALGNAPLGIYGLLAVLLPALFIIMGLSVRYTGIVRTDLAQRLSLFIPLTTAFLLFGETASYGKIAGIVLGFAAIVCTIPWHKNVQKQGKGGVWIYPLAVFAGIGVVDVFFKQIASFKALPYTGSLFIIFSLAFILSLLVFVGAILLKKTRFSWVNLFCGVILGLFNFGNILFYLKAHQALPNNPSVVFSAMNIGVIVAGALTGVFVFKEKLSLLNKAGLLIAVAAIMIIAFAR